MNRSDTLRQRLDTLQPQHLEIADQSSGHNVPAGAQSHFRVCIVSADFDGLSRVGRHRLVYRLLGEEFDAGLHALALQTFTPAEWEIQPNKLESPPCKGGH